SRRSERRPSRRWRRGTGRQEGSNDCAALAAAGAARGGVRATAWVRGERTEGGWGMKMYVGGQWGDAQQTIEVRNPYDDSVIDTVPRATRADVERALASAERGARAMARLTAHERARILLRAAELIGQRKDSLAQLISREEGKVIAEG